MSVSVQRRSPWKCARCAYPITASGEMCPTRVMRKLAGDLRLCEALESSR